MSRRGKNSDVTDRLVIARVGYCTAYTGDPEDEPRGGGSFNRTKTGAEHENFLAFGREYFGYAFTRGKLSLNRVTDVNPIDQGDDEELVEDVCIALIATQPGYRQVLVGWYRHARLFAYQHHRDGRPYQWTSETKNGQLLPVEDRRLVVPRGKNATGHAQYSYARDDKSRLFNRPYLNEIRKAILGWKSTGRKVLEIPSSADAIVRGQGFQADVQFRKEIEVRSMRVVERELRKAYATVLNVSAEESFDFLCSGKNGHNQKVEVKGTTSHGDSILVSRREFELAKGESVDLYVVSDIKIAETGRKVSATGGELTVYKNWSSKSLGHKPVGYEITLRTKPSS